MYKMSVWKQTTETWTNEKGELHLFLFSLRQSFTATTSKLHVMSWKNRKHIKINVCVCLRASHPLLCVRIKLKMTVFLINNFLFINNNTIQCVIIYLLVYLFSNSCICFCLFHEGASYVFLKCEKKSLLNETENV